MWPGEQELRDVDIDSYDQWLAWEHGLRLRRGYRTGGAEPDADDYRDADWGDQATLEASLRVVAPAAGEMVAYFYDRLFADNRHLRALFPDRMDEQRDRLLGALLAVVQDAARPEDLIARLEQLGRDHRKFGVRPAHYASVGKALIAAVSRFAGSAWRPEVEQAWLARYTIAVRIMLAASDADDRPPFWYATVVGHRRCGAEMAILQLRPHHPYPYEAGQYATLVSRRLPRVWRPYVMATAPGSQDLLEFHVRALGGGGLSDVLVEATTAGDVLRLGPPQGTTTLRAAGGRSRLFVESGVGWAPTKALLDQLARSPAADPAPARLVHIGDDGAPYDPDWARIHDRSPWLSTVLAHSPDEVAGCLPPAVPPAHLDSYVCGSPAVVASASTALASVGVPAGQILSTFWPGA